MNFKKFAALGLAGVMMASLFTGCGINKNEVVATMGDQEIKMGVLNFLCRYQQASYDDMFAAYVGEGAWEQDLYGSGEIMQETVKNSSVEMLHEFYTLQNHMDEYGVEISDEQQAAITEAAKTLMSSNDRAALNELGASQEIVEEVLTLYTIADMMWDAITADVDTNVSDEEANMRGFSYIMIPATSYTDADGNNVEYTEEEIEGLKQTAEAMAAIINGDADAEGTEDVESEDVEAEDADVEEAETEEADVDETAEEKTVLEQVADTYGYTARTGTYGSDDTSLNPELITVMDTMAAGDPAQVVVTDAAIYVVEVTSETDAEATEQHRETIINTRKDDHYNEVLAAWQDGDNWTVNEDVLAKIVFDDYFTLVDETEAE